MSEYTVRWFRDDAEAFLDLNRRVLGGESTRAWFDWKYVDNPFVDHVPVVLAERDDEIVGARGFMGLRMAVDGEDYRAFQPCDVMVDADHRRNGLFTRMTELGIERYESSDAAFFFSFPNANSFPAYQHLGWATVDQVRVDYRIQDPAAVAADMAEKTDNPWLRVAGVLATPVTAVYNGVRDWRTDPPGDVSVSHVEDVPAAELAEIAGSWPDEGIHARRDEAFYDWRFGNPHREYSTYLARNGDRRAAAVVSSPVSRSISMVKVADVLPLGADYGTAEKAALLARILEDNREADLFTAPSRQFPASTLRRFGFYSDQQFPLSSLSMSRTQVVRPLGSDLNATDLASAANWTHSLAELDTT